MEYYLPLAIAATTVVVYSIANYLSSPITPLLQNLGRTPHKNQPLTQLQHYNLVTQLKTTAVTQQLLPTTTTTTTIDPNPIVVALLRSDHGLPEQDPAFLTMLPKVQTLVHSLQLETLALRHLEQLRQTKFDQHNTAHRRLLDSLWGLLVPDVVREPLDEPSNHNSLASTSWSTIGFQGKDPTTDFRGMALLGLFQLVHFSCSRHSAKTLRISQAPKEGPAVKFFPFACAGIQITHLVLTLARERLLGFVVGQGHHQPPWSDGKEHQMARDAQAHMKTVLNQMKGVQDANDKDLIWDSVLLLNDVYSEIFILLGEEWEKENPPDVMSFGPIFKKVEMKIRAQLSAGVENDGKGNAAGACSDLEIRWRR